MDLLVNQERSLAFSQTTREFCEKKLREYDLDDETHFVTVDDMDQKLWFISFNFATKHKIRSNVGPVEYQVLKQRQQYDYIYRKLCSHEFTTLTEGFIYFEQTLDGNIHFHGVVPSRYSKQCIKADFLDCFGIKKGPEASYACNIKEVIDLNNLFEYLFNKQKKKYEEVDSVIFKPLKITTINRI